LSFIDKIIDRAKKEKMKIILPEATDLRVLTAAAKIKKEKIADIVLIGNEQSIIQIANNNSINIKGISIINPATSEKSKNYANALYKLRKSKGLTIEQAKELILDEVYFATMMVKENDADGFVSGAIHSTSDTLRPALQILKTAPNTKLVSAFFMMDVPNSEYGEIFLFGDCGLNENPDSEELSEIAIASARSFEFLTGRTARIAMLSYSTYGSAKSDYTKKVANATVLAKLKNPNLLIDGELQLDSAIVPEVADLKAPGSKTAGICNTLIFPNLDAGNIGYKLVQRLANAKAYGPLCQGIAKPVNDLSRGCSSEDIVGVVAITAVQAQMQQNN